MRTEERSAVTASASLPDGRGMMPLLGGAVGGIPPAGAALVLFGWEGCAHACVGFCTYTRRSAHTHAGLTGRK